MISNNTDSNKYIEFCNYIQPIVNGCFGFIKTEGYMTHFPGHIVVMSSDESFCAMVKIPVFFDIYITAEINKFLSLKTDNEKADLMSAIYFTGYNIKGMALNNYFSIYSRIDELSECIYYEPDCFNIKGFTDISSNVDIGRVNVTDGKTNYVIPASKSITQLNKSDTVSMKLYNCINDINNPIIKTLRYCIYKSKYKIYIDIFANILIV